MTVNELIKDLKYLSDRGYGNHAVTLRNYDADGNECVSEVEDVNVTFDDNLVLTTV